MEEVLQAKATKTPAKVEKPLTVCAVHRRMVDPHTGLAFENSPTEVFKMTPWVQCQIDEGKLKVC